MERRHFLKLAFGFAAGAAALAAGAAAEAAPLVPQPIPDGKPPAGNSDAQPAVTSPDEIDRLAPEQIHWGRGRRRGWGRRRWGWHRRRRRRWRRRYWRRRYYW